jgi:pterin-4a-carbinolamine dehydratase
MSQVTTPLPSQPKNPPAPPARSGDKLKAERVELMLAALPGWKLTPSGEAIEQQFRFEEPVQALAFAGWVCGLTARWEHRPEVRIAKATTVTFHLTTPEAGGLTPSDFRVARRLGRKA